MTRTRGLVTGPSFTSDVSLPDALFVCLLGSPHPRARLVSLDDSRARSLPGVAAVLSAASAPEVFETELRFRGDRVAACAAESVDSARRAIEALAPSYDILPPLGSHDADQRASILVESAGLEASFASADHILEVTQSIAAIPACASEPRSAWAWPDEDGRIVIRSASDSLFDTRREVAKRLGWPEGLLRVVQPRSTGATGSGTGVQHEDLLALLAKLTGRPVRLVQRRGEEIAFGVHHPGCRAFLRGAVSGGRIVAVDGQFHFDSGALGGPTAEGLDRALRDLVAPWGLRAFRLAATSAATSDPATTSRVAPALATAFGALVSAVARHTARTSLALHEQLVVDPALRESLARGASEMALPYAAQIAPDCVGVGLARAFRAGRGAATVSRHNDGSVSIAVPQTDLGPGIERDLARLAATALGVPDEKVVVGPSTQDTDVQALDFGGVAPAWSVAGAVLSAAERVHASAVPSKASPAAESLSATVVSAPDEAHSAAAVALLSLTLDEASNLPRLRRLVVILEGPAPLRWETVAARLEGEALTALGSAFAPGSPRSPRGAGLLSTLDAPVTQVLFALPPDGMHAFGDRSYLEAVAAAVLAAVRDACFSLDIEVERLPLSPAVFLQRRLEALP